MIQALEIRKDIEMDIENNMLVYKTKAYHSDIDKPIQSTIAQIEVIKVKDTSFPFAGHQMSAYDFMNKALPAPYRLDAFLLTNGLFFKHYNYHARRARRRMEVLFK